MTTLHCDLCIHLSCDAVTVLIVITSLLIYVNIYCIRTYKLLQPMASTCMHFLNICFHLLRCTVYIGCGVACAVNLLHII